MKTIVCALALCTLATQAAAQVAVFDYTATVTDVRLYDAQYNAESLGSASFDGTSFSTGYTLRGSFSLDSHTMSTFGQWGAQVQYFEDYGVNPNNTSTMKVDQTGYGYANTGASGLISYEGESEFYYASSQAGARMLAVSMSSDTDLFPDWALFSSRLPTSIDFAAADSAQVLYRYTLAGGGFYEVVSTIHTLNQHLAPVPEPSTWAMLGLGLLVAGAAARRRMH